jgi:hypothetical protein
MAGQQHLLFSGYLRACLKSPYNSEFGRICGVKRRKPGFSLQSFGYAKRISASIPCAPRGGQDIKQALIHVRRKRLCDLSVQPEF